MRARTRVQGEGDGERCTMSEVSALKLQIPEIKAGKAGGCCYDSVCSSRICGCSSGSCFAVCACYWSGCVTCALQLGTILHGLLPVPARSTSDFTSNSTIGRCPSTHVSLMLLCGGGGRCMFDVCCKCGMSRQIWWRAASPTVAQV